MVSLVPWCHRPGQEKCPRGGNPGVKADEYRDALLTSLREQESWRKRTLSLSAAENTLSPAVRSSLVSDLVHRYGDYQGRDASDRKYQGTRYIQQIESLTTELAQQVFHASHVELRAVSGHTADLAVILGLVRPEGAILDLGPEAGGHRAAEKLCSNPLIKAHVEFLPFDWELYNIDLSKTLKMMRELRPSLVLLGSSLFLFPHPVAAIKEEARRLGDMHVAYDASHVFGLLAGRAFQDPLGEGADVVMGSTHKTLPGPQGGLILTNDGSVAERVSAAVYPILVSNHHLFRMPALALALIEMMTFGKEYAGQVVANAKALGEAIQGTGVPVVGASRGFTESHTLLLQTHELGESRDLANRLEEANITVNRIRLPEPLGGQGLRLGVQEITRLGARETDMASVAGFVCDILLAKTPPAIVAGAVADFRASLPGVVFALDGPPVAK